MIDFNLEVAVGEINPSLSLGAKIFMLIANESAKHSSSTSKGIMVVSFLLLEIPKEARSAHAFTQKCRNREIHLG